MGKVLVLHVYKGKIKIKIRIKVHKQMVMMVCWHGLVVGWHSRQQKADLEEQAEEKRVTI